MPERWIITVDPGHGGRQPGAVGPTGVQEKVVCLAVALQVRELLRGRVDVRLTRETDIDVPLARRLAVPGSACYISIHCNAHADRTANGTETFHVAGRTEGARLAGIMQRHLLAQLRLRDRGVKTAAFQVIRQARVPAVLVEMGFISNHTEEGLLESERGQAAAARAIADGALEFVGVRLRPPTPPQSQPTPPTPPPAGNAGRTHTIAAGDTLWDISREYGVTVAQLRQWNGLTSDTLRIGQRLRVQA